VWSNQVGSDDSGAQIRAFLAEWVDRILVDPLGELARVAPRLRLANRAMPEPR
jgi:hypothetical protein